MEKQKAVERMFILDGGLAFVEDGSVFSPGVNVGVPMTLSCNAYLIRHADSWLLWDTGTQDNLIEQPQGRIVAHGIRGMIRRTLASQLQEIGVAPEEIGLILISHAHYDHVGNCRMFGKARWIVQQAEYDAMFGPKPEFYGYVAALYAMMRKNDITFVEGDHDVFGDGAVRMISTPGHTLGHCSLLVRLPKTGQVLLSGDMAHNRENFRCRRVPEFNADSAATMASMDRVDALLQQENAVLWINHDTAQSETLPHAPSWIV